MTGIWELNKIELSAEIILQHVTFHFTFAFVIVTFAHKGLKLYYEKGDTSKVQALHVSKIRLILTRLDAATTPKEMQVPGYNLHRLTGELKDF